ncbi:hypothetical protein scyTo_0022056 [Scyliorhinus torazame]|uniref:Uncharacterized protein n=2 Tax=Scyliorhinus torazame TaxID=75743 RepID=A0A401QBC9_SCYTO|nr:hypothetical protein [Scyliorhinus torazame]
MNSELTVKAGEGLRLWWGLKPQCFNSETLAVTCGSGSPSSRHLCQLGNGGAGDEVKAANCTVRLGEDNGITTTWISSPRSNQTGNYTCCLGDGTGSPVSCARTSVNLTGATSGAESPPGKISGHSATLLLIAAALLG